MLLLSRPGKVGNSNGIPDVGQTISDPVSRDRVLDGRNAFGQARGAGGVRRLHQPLSWNRGSLAERLKRQHLAHEGGLKGLALPLPARHRGGFLHLGNSLEPGGSEV